MHLCSFCTASAHTLLINAMEFKLIGLAILHGLRCTFDSYSLEILQISLWNVKVWRRHFLELSLAFSYYCLACIVMLNKHDGCSMDVLGLFFKSKYRYPLLGEANQYGERKFAPDHLSLLICHPGRGHVLILGGHLAMCHVIKTYGLSPFIN